MAGRGRRDGRAVPVLEQTAQAVIGPGVLTAQIDPVADGLDLDSLSVASV
jgi:hypothetical protein